MKSNTCPISADVPFTSAILHEVEKVSSYNELTRVQQLKLDLLAEELIGMLPNLSTGYTGSFWVENEGNSYELHASFKTDGLSLEERDRLLQIAKSGKNAAAVGIVGKIRSAFETMLSSSDTAPMLYHENAYLNGGFDEDDTYTCSWSLERYIRTLEQETAEVRSAKGWDELEKSVIAKLADDVVVGIRGSRVDLIVKKTI